MRRCHPVAFMLAALLTVAVLVAGCGGHTHRHATVQAPAAHGYQTPYGTQAHSPTFGLPPRGHVTLPRPSAEPTVEMRDSVTVSAIPAGTLAIAGYLNGWWRTFVPLVARFPHAYHVPVTVFAAPVYPSQAGRMACLDVEPGDASPAQAGVWDRGELALGVVPCNYANLSTMPAVKASILAAGLRLSQVFLWDADWTFVAHLDAGYQATQWTSHGPAGENYDETSASRAFLGIRTVIVIGGVQHYERYPATFWRLHGQRLRERNTVMTWDRAGCENPARRTVCRTSRSHLQLLLARDQAVYRRQSRAQRDASHTPGRIQGIVHRLDARGHVTHWL